ncbi:hypothetical protein ACG5V6_14960 [Streptomyces chitinivorans]|uniref:Terminase small subunit n=1 Tax=Streptomyces chitinivorans TaxID=1257027 RepID=A0ABW7HUC8_9ACTN|nr:hypothetical protein [Streptomyces chitinivorans]MDH2407184.1 hypothetical protein [Streptomyces chitinivorans]
MSSRGAPDGLGAVGGRLWEEITGEYELAPDELALLAEACRTADELEAMRQAAASGPVLVKGSTGQVRTSDLYGELRQHRLLLAKLLTQLALPDEDEDAGRTPAQQRASKAARVRWDLQRARDGAA